MIDYATIKVKAGDGGDGKVNFLRQKYRPKGGPDGGDGGDGGSVFVEVSAGINTLAKFRYKREYNGEDGEPGGKNKMHGGNGKEVMMMVPVGTEVKLKWAEKKKGLATVTTDNREEEELPVLFDLRTAGERVMVAQAGRGGRGNWHFRSSTNQTPEQFEEGTKGEEKELVLELKLLANVGLVGLPNAGKSTLLSVLTKADPKIASYPFTTLEPNLGVMVRREGEEVKSLVVADIPGLIEGAAEGKGLGHRFLRHVERTKLLVHLVAPRLEVEDMVGQLVEDYEVIRKELVEYSDKLEKKKELVFVSKMDLLSEEQRKLVDVGWVKKYGEKPEWVSAVSHERLDELREMIEKEFGEEV